MYIIFNSPLSQGVDTLIYSVSFESNFGCKGTSFLTTQIFDTPELKSPQLIIWGVNVVQMLKFN